MAIHTSAITYSRVIQKGYNNFFFVAQANNSVVQPMALYLRSYQFYNRNAAVATSGFRTLPWRN
jgi:hypothetical protein